MTPHEITVYIGGAYIVLVVIIIYEMLTEKLVTQIWVGGSSRKDDPARFWPHLIRQFFLLIVGSSTPTWRSKDEHLFHGSGELEFLWLPFS